VARQALGRGNVVSAHPWLSRSTDRLKLTQDETWAEFSTLDLGAVTTKTAQRNVENSAQRVLGLPPGGVSRCQACRILGIATDARNDSKPIVEPGSVS